MTPLKHRTYKIFHCWSCPEGHGTLYPKGELEKIVKAISGLGNLEVRIWEDRNNYTVNQAHLMSPDGDRPMIEIHDKDYPTIVVYADPETHSLWMHAGEEEKLTEQLEADAEVDSVGAYLSLAAHEAAKIFDDDESVSKAAGHTLAALKLLGERILRAMPHITF